MLTPFEHNEIINDDNDLCLFGIGALLENSYYQLRLALGKDADFFCDNSSEKWGKEYWGKKCISPAELEKNASKTNVIITVKNYEKIYLQLQELGIKNIFIACYDRGYNLINNIRKVKVNQPNTTINKTSVKQVRGKWTFITGASRGIGRQIAIEMAKLGSNILAHSRTKEHTKELIELCKAYDIQIVPISAELSNINNVYSMLSEIDGTVPAVDYIFNNAAISTSCPVSGFWDIPDLDYSDCFTVNTLVPILIINHFVPKMIERGFGKVVNLTSSVQNKPAVAAYACSKAALDKFTNDLAPSLQKSGVMISLVDPGWIRTDMTNYSAPNSVESIWPGVFMGIVLEQSFNGSWLSAQDYAGLSIEAAIDKARYILSNHL